MTYHYSVDYNAVGPVTVEQLRELHAQGAVTDQTLVLPEGAAQWGPYRTALGAGEKLPPIPPIPPPLPPPAAVPGPLSPAQPPPLGGTAFEETAAPDGAAYYYCSEKGKRVGPASAAEIGKLLDDGTLTNDTSVWREGFDDWVPIGRTVLRHKPKGPPPVPGAVINNALVWIVAFVPILGTIIINWIAAASGGNRDEPWTWWVFIGLNITLCAIDTSILKKGGYDTDRFGGWLWLVPVYLFKRAKALKQSLAYFTTWMICFFVSIFL